MAEGAPKNLNRRLVVDAALLLIDGAGADQLTMRSLGQSLGVEAMSLYRYVTGREDLLEAVVDLLLEGLSDDLDEELASSWQGYLQALAHAVRRIAVEHAAAFPLLATRHPAAPWLRPPLRSLELVDDFLTRMSDFGLTDEQVVATYRSFSSFLLGNLLLEAATRGAAVSPVENALDEGGATVPNADGELDLAAVPAVRRFRPLLSEDRSEEEFEAALETLLDRLERSISQ